METYRLQCHPDTATAAIAGVRVELALTGLHIWLRYWIDADPDCLALPGPKAPARADGLWQSTCCELFVSDASGDGYAEFNFSPSSRWAAYRFSAYRDGMTDLLLPQSPEISLDASESHLALEVELGLPVLLGPIALSAVIEELDGTKSYWALAHPPGKPDFHAPTCFAATLPAPLAP